MSTNPEPVGLEPTGYVKPSELARILGWSRTNVYYWLRKCDIQLVYVAGHPLVPVSDLARIVLTMKAAKAEALRKRGWGEDV